MNDNYLNEKSLTEKISILYKHLETINPKRDLERAQIISVLSAHCCIPANHLDVWIPFLDQYSKIDLTEEEKKIKENAEKKLILEEKKIDFIKEELMKERN